MGRARATPAPSIEAPAIEAPVIRAPVIRAPAIRACVIGVLPSVSCPCVDAPPSLSPGFFRAGVQSVNRTRPRPDRRRACPGHALGAWPALRKPEREGACAGRADTTAPPPFQRPRRRLDPGSISRRCALRLQVMDPGSSPRTVPWVGVTCWSVVRACLLSCRGSRLRPSGLLGLACVG